jgi:hypothetical protein
MFKLTCVQNLTACRAWKICIAVLKTSTCYGVLELVSVSSFKVFWTQTYTGECVGWILNPCPYNSIILDVNHATP